jgi:hypothetical protein
MVLGHLYLGLVRWLVPAFEQHARQNLALAGIDPTGVARQTRRSLAASWWC